MGNKKSGNPNQFTVSPDSEFGAFLNILIGKSGIGAGNWVKRELLKTYEKEYRTFTLETYGKDLYDDTLKQTMLTTYERKLIEKQKLEAQIQRQETKIVEKKKRLEEAKLPKEEKFEIGKCTVCHKTIYNTSDMLNDGLNWAHQNCLIRRIDKEFQNP